MKLVKINICILLMVICISARFKDYSLRQNNSILKVKLGKMVFYETRLSNPVGQSCASCHSANTAFSDPDNAVISEGAVRGSFGYRNAPALTYLSYTPEFYFNTEEQTYTGGFFWDGRASKLEEQIKFPFFSSFEMNIKDAEELLKRSEHLEFYSLYKEIYGAPRNSEIYLSNICNAVSSYLRSDEFNSFTSKFDYYLRGEAAFTPEEVKGYLLFKDTLKTKCSNCHLVEPGPDGKILFTDFTYDNIGVPLNDKIIHYKSANAATQNFRDSGLYKTTGNLSAIGQFKVPSLRNISLTKPYMHNGYFKTLEEVITFYNKRDVNPKSGWLPEIGLNKNTDEMGDLKLTDEEESALLAFLQTLTDGYKPNKN
jgi:cytochrome c peroxidase